MRSKGLFSKLLVIGWFGSLAGFQVWASAERDFDAAAFESKVKPFLEEYCLSCHNEEKRKGERRFDNLEYPIIDDDALVDFQDILDLLNLGDMPPEDEPQPSDAERQEVIDWMTVAVAHTFESRTITGGETILRRLNHREYFHTIGDLFQMDMSMFDPTETFPGERVVEHLDNVGDALVTSGYLLDRYLKAADQIVEKALPWQEKPTPQSWKFNGDFLQQPELNKRHMRAHGRRYLNIYEAPNTVRRFGSYAPLIAFEEGVPEGGTYEIRVLAEAVNRRHSFEHKAITNDPNEPMQLRVIPGHRRFGFLHMPQPFEPELGYFDLSDDGPQWYTTRSWLDKGFAPRFNYVNGTMDIRPSFRAVSKMVIGNPDPSIPEADLEEDYMVVAIKHGGVPHIRIHEVQIEGPFYDEWPTASWKAIIGNDAFDPRKTRKIIQKFATRAYRRPATRSEVNSLMEVVSGRIGKGHSPFEAMKDGLKAALCSPSFLYLEEEPSKEDPSRLNDYAVASRLSYFFWGTLPDERLLDLAKRKRLSRSEVLLEQVERMLDDDRSDRFISGFVDSWLTLRDLGDAPPDRNKFEAYYEGDLENAMRKETELYTRHAIDENQNLSCFLDSNYTFVNGPLAELYGLEGVKGWDFQKVALDDPRRGGLLGQASVLTVTANGIDTSPVYRGIWLLENILGTPPPPPPPDVEPLDPDIRGTKTIREQLDKHRNVESCRECHRKIDPLGFALENFDPIGGWRSNYDDRVSIDASGKMPDGSEFEDVVEFKKILLQKQSLFNRAVTEKMLAYALGRRIEIMDRPVIDSILADLEEQGGGFRDLITLVATSGSFSRP